MYVNYSVCEKVFNFLLGEEVLITVRENGRIYLSKFYFSKKKNLQLLAVIISIIQKKGFLIKFIIEIINKLEYLTIKNLLYKFNIVIININS